MKLSIGDKIRVYFYPPGITSSFIEGIVDRNEVKTMDGLSFSVQTTREVILGNEVILPRSLPYIMLYEKKSDDFEGRIEILEPAAEAEPGAEIVEEEIVAADVAAVEAEQETRNVVKLEPAPEADVNTPPTPMTKIGGWVRLLRRAA